jgi:hypothetical protein
LGRLDVDAMLDEMTPEQMDEWIAFGVLEPFGDSWRQTGTIAAEINNVYASKQSEIRDPEDYLPPESRQQAKGKRPDGLMDPSDYEKVSAARWSK